MEPIISQQETWMSGVSGLGILQLNHANFFVILFAPLSSSIVPSATTINIRRRYFPSPHKFFFLPRQKIFLLNSPEVFLLHSTSEPGPLATSRSKGTLRCLWHFQLSSWKVKFAKKEEGWGGAR